MPVHDQLLGSTQPVLSVSLGPGESIVGAGEFAWMTDSIQMTAGPDGLSAYTAKGFAGTIAFASRLPGSIVGLDIGPDREFLVHRGGFVAGTPGIEIGTGFRYPPGDDAALPADEFILRRISGAGRAWIELPGDVVRRELAAGTSLRAHPWHIGICDASVAIQVAELSEPAARQSGIGARLFAVLSGPGSIWLQSMPLRARSHQTRLASEARSVPDAEGAAGQQAALPHRRASA